MPELLRERKPKARIAHKCSSCLGAIRPGVTYTRTTWLNDGRVYDWLSCVGCDDIAGAVFNWLDYVHSDEGVGADDYEEWAQGHRDDAIHGQGAHAYLARRYPGTEPGGLDQANGSEA